jgi:hypothetical protein
MGIRHQMRRRFERRQLKDATDICWIAVTGLMTVIGPTGLGLEIAGIKPGEFESVMAAQLSLWGPIWYRCQLAWVKDPEVVYGLKRPHAQLEPILAGFAEQVGELCRRPLPDAERIAEFNRMVQQTRLGLMEFLSWVKSVAPNVGLNAGDRFMDRSAARAHRNWRPYVAGLAELLDTLSVA